MVLPIIIAVIVFVLDMVTKYAVAANLPIGESIEIIPGLLRFTNVSNDGIAFGMLSDARWLFMLATTLLVVFLGTFIVFAKNYKKMVYICAGLVLGGGMGNFVDRIAEMAEYDKVNAVVDFVDFYSIPFWQWTFNVADIAVCVGAALAAIYIIFFDKKAVKNGYKALVWEENKKQNKGRNDEN